MAQRTEITLIDDIDGKAADETVKFALDGVDYEIDLAERNARKLRASLQGWASKARRARGGTGTRRNAPSAAGAHQHGERLAAIRGWAIKMATQCRTAAESRPACSGHTTRLSSRRLQAHQHQRAGRRTLLVTDTCDVPANELYKSESSSDRATTRLAIGQTFRPA